MSDKGNPHASTRTHRERLDKDLDLRRCWGCRGGGGRGRRPRCRRRQRLLLLCGVHRWVGGWMVELQYIIRQLKTSEPRSTAQGSNAPVVPLPNPRRRSDTQPLTLHGNIHTNTRAYLLLLRLVVVHGRGRRRVIGGVSRHQRLLWYLFGGWIGEYTINRSTGPVVGKFGDT